MALQKWASLTGGAIDGTHIPIVAAAHLGTEYTNRKGYFSMVLQALVDTRAIRGARCVAVRIRDALREKFLQMKIIKFCCCAWERKC